MGRLTQPIRSKFNDKVETLRKEYKNALKDMARRNAFEKLVAVWSAEMGAITYAETISMFDLMILTATIENTRVALELTERMDKLEQRS